MSEQESSSGVLEAKSFVLRDDTGKVRARLAAASDGSPSLQFYDGNERSRVMISLSSNGTSGIQLTDAEGKPRVILSLDCDQPHVAPVTLALNGKGQGGISLWVSENGVSSIDFIGSAGEILLELPKGISTKTS